MDATQDSINQLQKLFSACMDAYQSDLQAAAPSTSIATSSSEFAAFRESIMKAIHMLQDQVALLASQMDSMEMRSRRKILLIHGLPEAKSEDVTAAVVKAVLNHMGEPKFSSNDISRCHRMGVTYTSDRPRTTLLELRDLEMRNKLWFSRTKLKGSGITVSEFLTKTRHDTFMAARQRYGIKGCWSLQGTITVLGANGVRHRVHSLAELDLIDAPENPKKVPVPKTQTRRAASAAGKKAANDASRK